MERIFEGSFMLHDVANYLMQRHNVIASNLANIRTPQYVRKELSFENKLQIEIGNRDKMTKTDDMHIAHDCVGDGDDASISSSLNVRNIHGSDKVDLDKEMALMAKNTMQYNAVVDLIKKDFSGLSSVLSKEI